MKRLLEKERVLVRKKQVEDFCGKKLCFIENIGFDPELVVNKNCENMIGTVKVPLGIAGPLKLQVASNKLQEYLLPLATTEGALVASVNRGCKAVYKNGVKILVEEVGATRGPVFKVKNLAEGKRAVFFIKNNWKKISLMAEKQEKHLRLKDFSWQLLGKNLYLRFNFTTDEAMGMNMVTMGTAKIASFLVKKLKIKLVSLSGNFCIDKKPAGLNFILGRGKKVWSEAIIDRKIVKDVLRTTPEKIVEVVERKCLLGSVAAGSLGFNAHFANIVAALFLATGQDLGHVVEGSLGVTTAELCQNGDLYFSCFLPSLMVGTVGGGTSLPTQKEALSILGMGEGKKGESLDFARVVGGAVLAGELSLVAALAAHHLAKAHQALGRGKRND